MFNDPAFIIDVSGRIYWANEKAVGIFNLPAPFISRDLFGLLEPASRDNVKQRLLVCLRKGKGSFRTVFRNRSACSFPAEVNVSRFDVDANTLLLASLRLFFTETGGIGETHAVNRAVDPLTGLLLRDSFEHWSPEGAYALAMVDVDDLKQVNDAYGHSVGDQLLAKVGAALEMVLDPSDSAYRYGGDEFIVTGPNAEGLRSKLSEARKLVTQASADFVASIHISFGIAESHEAPERAGVLSLADSRMYDDKNARKQQPLEEALRLSLLVAEEMDRISSRPREGEWTAGSGRTAVTCRCIDTGRGSVVLLTGGDQPHIGAVALSPDFAVRSFPGHRDGELIALLLQSLRDAVPAPMVIAAGFHADSITAAEIEEVFINTGSLALILLDFIKNGG